MSRVVPGAIQAFATAFLVLLMVCSTLGQVGIDAAAQTSVTKTAAGTPLPAAGRVIVVLKRNEIAAASDFAAASGISPTSTYDEVISGFAADLSSSQIRNLAQDPAVANIVENRQYSLTAQNVPTQITRTAIDTYPPANINGVEQETNVDIAIIDSGIDGYHSDLNVVGGADCVDGTDPYYDGNGHGTHVAGIAAARDNSYGVVGAAPGARLWAVKVLDSSGYATFETYLCGLEAVAQNDVGIDVVNLSLGAYSGAYISQCYDYSDPEHDAICSIVSRGITVVVAAGNDSADAANYSPAKFPEVVTVASMTDYNGAPGGGASDSLGCGDGADDTLSNFSNYGAVVDIVAPGSCLLSTFPGNSYGYSSGTSMASPLVAGAAALYKAQNPSASVSAVRSWLLSSASVPANSTNGYSGASYRLLYLGNSTPPVSNPPGILNPTFSGAKATTTNAFDSPNTGTANRVRDGNSSSNWATAQNYPNSAAITVDLGASTRLSGIKWLWTSTSYADQFEVRVGNSTSGPWTTVGKFGNGTATYTWFGASTNATGRFVQFYFTNPNRDLVMGALGEVEIWRAVTTNSPGTQNPVFNGSKVTLTNAFDSPNSGTANRVRDGVTSSNWASPQNYPNSAAITVDLGRSTQITGIRWLWTNTNFGDQFDVRVASSINGPWTTVGRFGNGTSTYTWFGTTTGASGRFVQFLFANPNRDLVLGAIGEIEVWRQAPTVNPPGTQDPYVGAYYKQGITNVFDSPNTGTASRVKDGVNYTNWAVQGTPSTATITLDMGSVRSVDTIRWMMPNLGYADQFEVRIATSYGSWTSLGTFGNPTASYTWFGIELPFSYNARFVQLVFTNPNNDVALGAVGEIEIWGGMPLAMATREPAFDGEPLAIEPIDATDGDVDPDGASSMSIAAAGSEPITAVLQTAPSSGLTGVRWRSGPGIAVTVSTSVDGATWENVSSVASIDSGDSWQGIDLPTDPNARFVKVEARPGTATTAALANLEVWGLVETEGSPVASPEAGTPIASPEAPIGTPVVTEEPSEAPATPVVTEEPTSTPTVEPTEAPATPVVTEDPTSTPTEEPIEAPATPVVTEEPTEEPTSTPTEEPTTEPTATATLEPTAEPTAAVIVGTITGTDGDLVNCRVSAPDGEPITQLAEGDAVAITGEAVDGWYPVTCAGQDGWVAEQFVTIGDVLPTEEPSPDASPTSEATEDVLPTEEPTLEPTAEPEVTAYEIVDTGDTEDSGTAWNAQDDDPSTVWSVSPSQAPGQVRLYLDLGQVRPIDRLTFTLRTWDQLPVVEIWLSEDAETWYNVTPDGINGWNLPRDEEISIALGYDARYIRLVIPHADESGLGQIGGIDDLRVWPGEITETALLGHVFAPTTPTPEDIPTEDPTEEVIPTEEPVVEEIAEPTEEPVVEEPTEEPVEEEIVEPTEELPAEEIPPNAEPTEEAVG
jgi:subtilisin family serine protease